MRDDGGVTLADARGLDDDQVEPGQPAGRDHLGQGRADLRAGVAGGERAHVDVRVVDGVHADAVAEQGPAGALARRVDADDGQMQPVLLVEAEAPHQFVGERTLARAAGAGDAEHRHTAGRSLLFEAGAQRRGAAAVFQEGDEPGEQPPVATAQAGKHRVRIRCGQRCGRDVGQAHHLVDHALQADALAISRGVDAADPVAVQLVQFLGHDHPAAAAEHADIPAAARTQQVDHVFEILDVAALVGGDGHALHILLQGRGDDLAHRAVVAQVDDLNAGGLEDTAHDVDGGVVAVEQRGGGDEADLVGGLVGGVLGGAGHRRGLLAVRDAVVVRLRENARRGRTGRGQRARRGSVWGAATGGRQRAERGVGVCWRGSLVPTRGRGRHIGSLAGSRGVCAVPAQGKRENGKTGKREYYRAETGKTEAFPGRGGKSRGRGGTRAGVFSTGRGDGDIL